MSFAALFLAMGWAVHGWSGYQPLPTLAKENQDGREVLVLTNVQGKSGGCIYTTPRTRCRAGDIVKVSFEARGTGKAFATVARYSAKSEYNQTCAKEDFTLTPEWKRHEMVFRIGDGTAGPTASCDFQLGVLKGGEARFAAVTMDFERRAFEDFEGTGPHVGQAQVITGNIAPGLLSVTRMGVVRAAEPREIAFEACAHSLPAGGSNPFLEASARLYSFGRTARTASTLDFRFAAQDGNAFVLTVAHDPSSDKLACTLTDRLGGQVQACGRLDVPYGALPADFVVSAAQSGDVLLNVTSLADSSHLVVKGQSRFFAKRTAPMDVRLLFTPKGGEGELVLDNYAIGRADPEVKFQPVPFAIEKAPTFDPVAAGWPLVFADEFNGAAVDMTKWEMSKSSNPDFAFLKDGILHIRCDWDEAHKKLKTASLWTHEKWAYGYFESRLRFTRNSGWWAAFWLCTHSTSNPFLDGFEIDIFEDYYTRCDKPDGVHKPILDHNLHMFGSAILKSWNYRSELPGSLDDFYVLGCKWTPFEISYYLNGKLIASQATHSGHKSVTFDPISHGTGFSPLSAIVSGQIMNDSWFCHDTTGFTFPEDFLVDYVRVYAYPEADKPKVTLKGSDSAFFAKPGERQRFSVTAQPAADGAKIKAVYLFDSGYLIDYRTEPPYDFEVTFSEDYYAKTRYMRPGRSGKLTPLAGTGQHVFAAYALDEKGRYAHADETVGRLLCDLAGSRPYRGVAHQIPGVIKCGLYDEGGPGVAYSDTTPENVASKKFRPDEGVDAASETCIGSVNAGEWLTYTVDIAKAGDYRAVFTYGTPEKGQAKLHVFVDGKKAGTFDCPAHAAAHWGADTKSVIERLPLPAGRHRLTILCEERFNFSTLEFTP